MQADPARRPEDAEAALSWCARLYPRAGVASPTQEVPVKTQPVGVITARKAEAVRATAEVLTTSDKSSELIFPVELDETSLAQLGCKGDARGKIVIDDAYETNGGKMTLECAFNLSATLNFHPALWVGRYQRSGAKAYARAAVCFGVRRARRAADHGIAYRHDRKLIATVSQSPEQDAYAHHATGEAREFLNEDPGVRRSGGCL